MKRVLVLQHAEVERPGLIADVLASGGYSIQPILPFNGDPIPQGMEEAQGLVIMGGPMGAYECERYPYLKDELQLIEKTLRESKPILAVCLGSQLLATALGAEVRKGKQKEIGWHSVGFTGQAREDPLLTGIDQAFMALHWHGDIFDLPRGAVRLASSSLTECQAFRYGRHAYGFLFHMEMNPEILQAMAGAFTDELSQEGIEGEQILRAAGRYLPNLQQIGRTVFERWATLVNKE